MILPALLLALSASTTTKTPATTTPASALAPADVKAVRARFEELAQEGDRAGCVALWKEHPGLALPVIDRDLEGALKVVESKSPDAAKVAKLHERALWGAAIAFANAAWPARNEPCCAASHPTNDAT